MTGRQLITDVLQDLEVLGAGEELDAADAQFVFRRMNQWIDSLALERLMIYFYLRTVTAITAATASRTIGTGGNISIVRPDTISAAGLIIDNTATTLTEIPVEVISLQAWEAITQKTLTSPLTRFIYYDRGWTAGLGIIYLYPIPTVSTTSLVTYTERALTQFADLDTVYTFPPGYELFLRTNLPAQVAAGFGKTVSADLARNATEARAKVKRSNIKAYEKQLPFGTPGAVRGGAFDWRTGE